MTKQNSRLFPVVPRRKPKKAETNLTSLGKARLKELIDEAVVDAYGEDEQTVGFLTMIQEHLALPFQVNVLGVDADVEEVDLTEDGQIAAICRRGKRRQKDSDSGSAFANAKASGIRMDCSYRHWRIRLVSRQRTVHRWKS